jgi:hypothetical protein
MTSPLARWVWDQVCRDLSPGPLDTVARKVGVDRHNLRKLLDGTTRNPRLWVLEGLARAGGTSVDALRTLLPDGATFEEAAAKRMGAMDPALKLKGGRVRAEMLRDPDSPYRRS